jgi:hypothetical protein
MTSVTTTAAGVRLIAGVDEDGRRPLAGPVFAAAVILDPQRGIPGIGDSKKRITVTITVTQLRNSITTGVGSQGWSPQGVGSKG